MKLFLCLVLLVHCYGQQGLFETGISPLAYQRSHDGSLGPAYVRDNGVYRLQSAHQQPNQHQPNQYQPQPQPQSYNTAPSALNEPVVGAVYFMTNDPRGNAIISNSIHSSGSLGYSKSFTTGGIGGYNIPQAAGKARGEPDPLASQNSLIVDGDFLFAVNAGSNSVSMFTINPREPTELTHVTSVLSGGDFPVALAFSRALQMLCVLNTGKSNGVQCFSIQSQGSSPTPSIYLLPETAKPFGLPSANPPKELGSMSDVIFTPDSSRLLVSVKGNPDPRIEGFIAAFPVTENSLGTPMVSVPTDSVTPWGMIVVPGTGLTSDPVIAFSDPFGEGGGGFGIATLNRRTGEVSKSAMILIPGQMETCWTVFSPRTGSLYTTDAATTLVTESRLDLARHSARLLNQYHLGNSSAPIDASIASLVDKDVMYVLTSGEQSIHAMSLLGPGQAALLHRYFPAAGNPGMHLNKGLQGLATYVVR